MKRPAAYAPAPKPVKEEFDVEQGSDEWLQLRLGVPTASHFADVLAGGEGKMRRTYMLNLAGERLSGLPAEDFVNEFMNRGKRMEPQALASYELRRNVQLRRVGFVRRGRIGASPDSLLVAEAGAVEVKTVSPKLLIPRFLDGHAGKVSVGMEHRAQCHGVILVCELNWCDLFPFWPGLPDMTFRFVRDDAYLRVLEDELDRFCDELDSLCHKLRGDPAKLAREMDIPR